MAKSRRFYFLFFSNLQILMKRLNRIVCRQKARFAFSPKCVIDIALQDGVDRPSHFHRAILTLADFAKTNEMFVENPLGSCGINRTATNRLAEIAKRFAQRTVVTMRRPRRSLYNRFLLFFHHDLSSFLQYHDRRKDAPRDARAQFTHLVMVNYSKKEGREGKRFERGTVVAEDHLSGR